MSKLVTEGRIEKIWNAPKAEVFKSQHFNYTVDVNVYLTKDFHLTIERWGLRKGRKIMFDEDLSQQRFDVVRDTLKAYGVPYRFFFQEKWQAYDGY